MTERLDKTLLVDWVDSAPRLVIRALEGREPGPGEVRYRVHAIGLNRADLAYMQGGHYTATVFPSRICYEAAGTVDAVGEGVSEFKVGDRVSAIPFGDHAYCVGAESAITPAHYLGDWPAGYSAAEAAAIWMQYCTAYFPFKELSPVGRGDNVLVSAASSSAGLGAIQMARLLGATVVASTRTPAKREFLLRAGAHHVVTMSEGGLKDQILACTNGEGARVVYDAVGGSFMHEYAEAVARDAQIFVYGAVAGDSTVHAPILPLIRQGAVIRLYSLINLARDLAAIRRARLFISLALRAGALRPIVDRVFPFERAAEAFDYMQSGAQRGKIVLLTALGAGSGRVSSPYAGPLPHNSHRLPHSLESAQQANPYNRSLVATDGAMSVCRGDNMRISEAVILLCGFISAGVTLPSYAADDSSDLAEVIVVARKRQENVQDVPDSLSVFTDQQIEDARIQDIQDFAALTPNFEIHQGQGPGVFQMSIRGISQANKGEAPVTMVVDGVTLPYSDTFTAPLFDVQQIEVLKGPQGALYGQNSIGGAIVITTKQPTNTYEGSTQASVGRGGETREVGVFSGPIINDTLFFRVGAIYHDSPGLVDYAFIPGQTADYLNEKGARGELKAVFGEDLTAVLGVEWHRTAGGALPLVPTSQSFGSGIPNVTTQQVDQHIIQGVPSQNSPTLNNLENESVSLKIDWRLPIATLTSVSSWENESESIYQDLDVSDVPFVQIQNEYTPIHAWLQDLRLTSNTSGPFEWIVGLFAQQVHYALNDDTVQLNTNLLGPPPVNLSPAAANWAPFELNNLDQHLDAYAASAQGSYKFLDHWELTLAGRYDYDPRNSTEQTFNGVEPQLRATYKEFEPKASLSYAFDAWGAEQHAYLTYAKGFRPGGFNSNAASQVAVAFPAETTQDLEVGTKFVLFEHKATLDLAAYHNIYKNQQETLVVVNGAGEASSDIFTIDKTTINGGELTLQARPIAGIDVGASFGYTDATVTSFGNSLSGTGLNAASFDGKTVPLVSKYTLNVNFQQTVPLTAQMDGFYRVDFNRYGRLYWYPDNASSQNPYNLVDLQVGARFAKWSVDAYGRNIFGQRYNVLFFDNNFVRAPGGFNFAYRSLPSTFGIEGAYHFK